jgi:hypothetical protein
MKKASSRGLGPSWLRAAGSFLRFCEGLDLDYHAPSFLGNTVPLFLIPARHAKVQVIVFNDDAGIFGAGQLAAVALIKIFTDLVVFN